MLDVEAGPPLRLTLFGTPCLRQGGVEQRFPDRRCIALVAVLALDGRLSRSRMAGLLWDDQADTDARRNLRRVLHRLRESGLATLVQSVGEQLSIDAAVAVDTTGFVAACDSGDVDPALAYYTGPLMDGFDIAAAPAFSAWLAARREGLAQRWRAVVESRCEADQRAGNLRAAIALALRLVDTDTLHESHYRRAMALHAAAGEREAALALYERCRKVLGRELGLRPLAATFELAERIRQGTATVVWEAAAAPLVHSPLQSLPATAPMVGRESVLDAIAQAIATTPLTLLHGEAGIGKSRLLHAMAARMAGAQFYEARIGDRRVPYAALVRWLRAGKVNEHAALPAWVRAELSRLLPELGTPPPPLTSDIQRLRLFEAVREAWQLWFGGVSLHVFDDWQFVDDTSALWWGWWLGQSFAGKRTPVLVAERPGQAGAEAAAVLRDAMAAAGARPAIELGPLSDEAVFALVKGLSGTERPARFAHRLWLATGGHPFYAIETLQHLLQTAVIRVDEQGQWRTPFDQATDDYHELPIAPSVHAAVMQRVQAMDEAAQRLLEAASLTGDDFTLQLVASATALDDWEAVRALESTLRARVVTRHPSRADTYRFEHDLFAQAVAAAVSPERRRLMHRALGQRLAQDGAAPARVAEHLEQGGEPQAACQWRCRALEAARQRHALADMLTQAQQVLALTPTPAQAIGAHLARAAALLSQAKSEAARAALQQAVNLLNADDPIELHVDVAAAQTLQATREDRAQSALEPLTTLLADARLNAAQRGRLFVARSGCLRGLGRVAESEADLDAALVTLDDEPSFELGSLLDDRARSASIRGDFANGLAWARRSVAVMESIDHASGLAAAVTIAGLSLLGLGRFEEALLELKRARAIARQHGLISAERSAILNLAATLLALGESGEAIACVEEGYALSTLFSGPAEKQAFVEARYQCRVEAGRLGDALDARPELLESSRAIAVAHRRHSGLLVSTDLPLMLGDAASARAPLHDVLSDIASGTLDYFAAMALAKASWLALLEDNLPLARQRIDAACSGLVPRAEDLAFVCFAQSATLLAQGEHAAARAALRATRQAVGAEAWALYLAGALRVQHASGGIDPELLMQAREELARGKVPPLNTLDLIDALAQADAAGEFEARARSLALALHASLARHASAQALFAQRFARWLPKVVALIP